MAPSLHTYDLLGAPTYLAQLPRTELEDIVRSAGSALGGMTKARLLETLLRNPNMARNGLEAIERRCAAERGQVLASTRASATRGVNTRRENLSLALSTSLMTLTDDEYEQVLALATTLQGARTPQFY